jgi:hypothetical protein
MATKVGVLTTDCIFHVLHVLSIKYQNYILNVIFGIEIKHASYYNKNYFLHEDLDYSQMCNFVFKHDD